MKHELGIEQAENETPAPELSLGISQTHFSSMTTVHPASMLLQIFADDPVRGIFRVPENVELILKRERMNVSLGLGEHLVVEFFDPRNERSILFLTKSRLIIMDSAEPGGMEHTSMHYAQIADITRHGEDLYLIGRTGEQLGIHGLTIYQSAALQCGLGIFLGELTE